VQGRASLSEIAGTSPAMTENTDVPVWRETGNTGYLSSLAMDGLVGLVPAFPAIYVGVTTSNPSWRDLYEEITQ
jgi:hypothetical protein